jgi:hypothetical protein
VSIACAATPISTAPSLHIVMASQSPDKVMVYGVVKWHRVRSKHYLAPPLFSNCKTNFGLKTPINMDTAHQTSLQSISVHSAHLDSSLVKLEQPSLQLVCFAGQFPTLLSQKGAVIPHSLKVVGRGNIDMALEAQPQSAAHCLNRLMRTNKHLQP